MPSVVSYPVDLLKNINAERDAIAGAGWELTDSGLQTGVGRAARLQIPVGVPKQYVLTLRVLRKEGNGPLLLGLPVGESQCSLLLDRDGNSGIGVNSRNELVEQTDEIRLPHGSLVEIQCRVGESQIRVSVDGEERIVFQGDFSGLMVPEAYQIRRTDILFVATNRLRNGEDTRFEIPLMTLDSVPAQND